MKYFKYASYLFRHKFYVFVECCKHGMPFRGLFHDMSKFRHSEWVPYANFFYDKPKVRDKTGYYKPTDTGDKAFDFAWLLHQKRNKHHWQWWVLPEDRGGVKVLPMDEKSRLEMVCDWKGAGKAQGHTGEDECKNWYLANNHKMQLHHETKVWVEDFLGIEKAICYMSEEYLGTTFMDGRGHVYTFNREAIGNFFYNRYEKKHFYDDGLGNTEWLITGGAK